MDWTKAIGMVTGIVTCATAILTYLREKAKKPSETSSPPRLRIRHMSLGASGSRINSLLRCSLPLTGAGALCFLVLSIRMIIETPSVIAAASVAFWALGIASFVYQFLVLRKGLDKPTKLRKETCVVVDGTYDEVLDRCHAAVIKLPAKVISFDRDSGLICARTRFSWRSFGEKVNISVTRQDGGTCSVGMASDCVVAVTLLDYGKNLRNLEFLVENL